MSPPSLKTLEHEPTVAPATDELTGLDWLELSPRTLPRLQIWRPAQARFPDALKTALEPELTEPPEKHSGRPREGVIVITAEHGSAPNVLRSLRRHPLCRLRPILVVGNLGPAEADAALADAIARPTVSFVLSEVSRLSACEVKLQELVEPDVESGPERAELDLIRFIHTRELDSLEPVADIRAPIGFRYPIAEALLNLPTRQTLAVLEEFGAAALLSRRLEERLHLCPSCGSSRLILREVCPGCQSPSLRAEATLHHFPCAHVAAEQTFRQGDDLVCPKCHKLLRHIGVDYDRPQDELICDHCSDRCVEGVAGARCLECDTRTPAELTDLVELSAFSPTAQLQSAAAESWPPLSSPADLMTSALSTVDSASYDLLLEHTRAVCRRYGREASVITIELKGLSSALDSLGRSGVGRLLKQMAAELREKTRSTDAVSVKDHSVKILLTETGQQGRDVVLTQLSRRLRLVTDGKLRIMCSGELLLKDPEDA